MFIGISETARRLGKSEATIKRACISGSLGLVCRKNGKAWEIDEDSVSITRARDITKETTYTNVISEEISKAEYERRIKKEDWLKKQIENKIKSGEYGRLSVLCAIVGDYFSIFYQELKNKIDKKVISGLLTNHQAEEIWLCIVEEQELILEKILEKIKNAHI